MYFNKLLNKFTCTCNFVFLCIFLFSFFQIFQILILTNFFKVFPCFGPSTRSTFPRIFFYSGDKFHPVYKKPSLLAQGAEESYLTTKQWTCLNKACYLVTRLVKFYPQDKRPTMVARRVTLSESEAFRNEARSAEKKKTTREETKTTWFVQCGL